MCNQISQSVRRMESLHEIISLFMECTEFVPPCIIKTVKKLSYCLAIVVGTAFEVNPDKFHDAWMCSVIELI